MLYARWYLLLLGIKRWHRYAVTALLFIILLLVWLFLLYLPLYRQLAMIRMQLNQSKQDLQTHVSERELCKALSQEIQELQHVTKEVSLTSGKTEEHIGLIINQIKSLPMRLLSIKKIGSVPKEQYITTLVSVQAQGALVSISQFFNMLKNNQNFVQCSHFTVQHERDDLYMLHAVLRFFSVQKSEQNESPSTLEKS